MTRRTQIIIGILLTILAAFIATTRVYSALQAKLAQRIEKGWVIPPLELYSQGFSLSVGRRMPIQGILEEFRRRGLHPERDYVIGEAEACALESGPTINENAKRCLWLKRGAGGPLVVTWDEDEWIVEIWSNDTWEEQSTYSLFPRLITQFLDGHPIQQTNTPLSETPLQCLQAVTAIEDQAFLEHMGVSATGTMRAVIRNIKAGRFAEGGSTITQQLVKVFLLNSKKTIKRKVEEQLLALILESQLSKDQILEMYLNVIYMGQNGPYQVHGFGSASLYYFDKPLTRLNLPECALLAAIINNPGRFSPFTKSDSARSRRELVLQKMMAAGMISEQEQREALATPLPTSNERRRPVHAPYFVMSALKEFSSFNLDSEEGARLYTTLDPDLQTMLNDSVDTQLPTIEARIKKPGPTPLQVAALTVDLENGQLLALMGGRDFRSTQFNRVSDSRRQIGSVAKPFVYYPAMFDHLPTSEVLDEPFDWKTGKQSWRPKNYDHKSHGNVPYFFALAESLNIATAKIGQQVGLESIASGFREAGATSEIVQLPSLTLGAVEFSPLETAQVYSTLAKLGDGVSVHSLTRVEDLSGAVLYQKEPTQDFHLEPRQAAMVVGMLQHTFTIGTAQAAKHLGLEGIYAGKTGTTSDTKDAWFVGFSPRILTVVWVGYDDNWIMGLTGASGALPIWTDFNIKAAKLFKPVDFNWPDGVTREKFSGKKLEETYPSLKNMPDELELTVPN